MFEITVDASAFKVKADQLLNNIPQALKAAGLVILAQAAQSIKAQGPGWAPFKRLPKRPHQLLYDTGHLIQSLQYGNADNIFDLGDTQLTVGSNLRYAAVQQFGNPSHNLPARPYLVITSGRLPDITAAFTRRLMQGV